MKLKNIIRRLINRADLEPGKTTAPHTLTGGITIKVRRDPQNDYYTVYLSRAGVTPPSETEIETFLNHWPDYRDRPANFRAGVVFEIPIPPEQKGTAHHVET